VTDCFLAISKGVLPMKKSLIAFVIIIVLMAIFAEPVI
jgi:hypothetical protein